jgi:hypothetical protein
MLSDDLKHFQVLEKFAALPVEGHEEEWKELMALLSLPVGSIASVQLILNNETAEGGRPGPLYPFCVSQGTTQTGPAPAAGAGALHRRTKFAVKRQPDLHGARRSNRLLNYGADGLGVDRTVRDVPGST